jgi:hypothetical protein
MKESLRAGFIFKSKRERESACPWRSFEVFHDPLWRRVRFPTDYFHLFSFFFGGGWMGWCYIFTLCTAHAPLYYTRDLAQRQCLSPLERETKASRQNTTEPLRDAIRTPHLPSSIDVEF